MSRYNAIGKWIARVLFAAVLAAHGPSWACDAATEREARTPTQFMVSAVLRRDGPGIVIKLVQATEAASSADEATARVLRRAKIDYAEYSVLSTLTSPLTESAPVCVRRRGELQAAIPAAAHQRITGA